MAENSFAQKNGYRINDNQEILAFALGNFVAAFTGCCPINGSVSRTAMGEQYQGKTQLTGIVAGFSMMLLLLVGTGFIGYLADSNFDGNSYFCT
ncbi:MAG: SulP family inorganic anion transporter [Eubacterium sp.]